jgi:hypothetical protein
MCPLYPIPTGSLVERFLGSKESGGRGPGLICGEADAPICTTLKATNLDGFFNEWFTILPRMVNNKSCPYLLVGPLLLLSSCFFQCTTLSYLCLDFRHRRYVSEPSGTRTHLAIGTTPQWN